MPEVCLNQGASMYLKTLRPAALAIGLFFCVSHSASSLGQTTIQGYSDSDLRKQNQQLQSRVQDLEKQLKQAQDRIAELEKKLAAGTHGTAPAATSTTTNTASN